MQSVKFLLLTLITHHPDPVTGEKKSPADRLREVIDAAVLTEELGYEGFAVGERHEDPFISSSPPVVLSHIAARTSVGRYHEQLGHQVIHLSAEADGVTVGQKRRNLELFQSAVAPALRQQIPSRRWAAQLSRKEPRL